MRGVVPLGMVITYLPSISAVTRRRLAGTGAGLPLSASRRPQEGGKKQGEAKTARINPKRAPRGKNHLLNPHGFGERRDLGQKVARGGRASAPSTQRSSSPPKLFLPARALPPCPPSSSSALLFLPTRTLRRQLVGDGDGDFGGVGAAGGGGGRRVPAQAVGDHAGGGWKQSWGPHRELKLPKRIFFVKNEDFGGC